MITRTDLVVFANTMLAKYNATNEHGIPAAITHADISNYLTENGLSIDEEKAAGLPAVLRIPAQDINADCRVIRELVGKHDLHYDIEMVVGYEGEKPIKKRFPNIHHSLVDFGELGA